MTHEPHERHGIGDLLDSIGVGVCRPFLPHERVTEALVLMKIVNLETNEVSLLFADNEIDWITRRGLLSATNEVLTGESFKDTE